MTPSGDPRRVAPHIALLPSAGMGHLTPFCRLAVALSDNGCDVSFITIQPTVSSAESRHVAALLSAFPRLRPLEFRLADFDPSNFASTDPFFLRFEATRRSAHLLPALLAATSPPVSAIVVDISLVSSFLPVVTGVGLPCYVLFTASATMLSFCAHFPAYIATRTTAGVGDVEIPGLRTVPKASIPLPLHDPNNLFTTQFVENGRILRKADGILINTFHALEKEALDALNRGKVLSGLPPVVVIGPLKPVISCEGGSPLPWLDAQPARSVVYVSFGSRTAMSADQMKELGTGLERSGCRFLWVVKSKMVDRVEVAELEELLGEEYLERVKERGLVVKGWVDQEKILRHRAVGGFVSHCGWNSVTEAALHGVPILAWPRIGDQRVNADVMARVGLGIWVKEWSWEGEEKALVGKEEIGERVRELMEDDGLRTSAARLGKEAVKAVAVDGSSCKGLAEFIGKL